MEKPPFFIVNPKAADGRLGAEWPDIARRAGESLGEIAHRFTESAGHATQIAREAAEAGHRLIVSCGGDGTNNEVVNGLIRDDQPIHPDLVMGFLPFGTGGDLRRTLGTDGDVASHLARLAGGRDLRADIGRIDYTDESGAPGTRYFLNIASAGMGGLVDLIVNSSSKRLGGKATFMLATLRALVSYKYPELEVQVDGGQIRVHRATNVAVANGRFFGGGMHVAPKAEIDDGLMDIVVIEKTGLVGSAISLPDLYKGTHLRHDFVHHQTGRVVTIRPVDPTAQVYLDVDGEVPGLCPATFTALPGRLNLRVDA